MKSILAASCVVLAVAGVWADTGRANIVGTKPDLVTGVAMLQDTPSGLKIDVDFTLAPAGQHAFHIHEFGACENEAKAAGSHYNPAGHMHGNTLKEGIAKTHSGDFGNVVIDAQGKGSFHAVVPGLALAKGDSPVAGRAFVLHEKLDDFSQPTGNAGSRIGCGPIILTGK